MNSRITTFVERTNMEVQHIQKRTIWGNRWEPLRKWVYPAWLLYELSYRFCQYAMDTYKYIDEISTQTLAVSGAVLVFLICTAFLTVSSCFILFRFFKKENLTQTSFEVLTKRYL